MILNFIVFISFIAMFFSCGAYETPFSKIDSTKSIEVDDLNDDGILPSKWEHNRTWSIEEEERYSKWIEINYTKDFFIKRNLWADCADSEILRRTWYAIKRGLPMAYRPVYDTNIIVSSYHYRDRSPMDFINDIRNGVSTKNLALNSYKIRIEKGNSKNLKPGIFNLYHGAHTQPIAQIDLNTGLMLIRESTLVSKPITLAETFYFIDTPSDTVTLRRQFSPIEKDGNMTLSLLDPSFEQIGPYGNGQIEFGHVLFFEWVQTVILNLDINDLPQLRKKTVDVFIDDILGQTKRRIDAVEEGYKICRNYSGTDPLLCAPGHEGTHSTPSRDERLRDLFNLYGNYLGNIRYSGIDPETADYGEKLLNEKNVTIKALFERSDPTPSIPYETTYSLAQIKSKFLGGFTSSDPRGTIQSRWGETILNIYSAEPLKDLNTLSKYSSELYDELSSFNLRHRRIQLYREVCGIPGYQNLCNMHSNQIIGDDYALSKGVHQFIKGTVDVPSDILIDMNLYTILNYGDLYNTVVQSGLQLNLKLQDYLTNLTKQIALYAFSSTGSTDGPIVLDPHRFQEEHSDASKPITVRNAELIINHTSELSYERWLLLKAHFVEKIAAATRKIKTGVKTSSDDETSLVPLDEIPQSTYIYTLFQFVTSFDNHLVKVDPTASEEDIWGGKPTAIPGFYGFNGFYK